MYTIIHRTNSLGMSYTISAVNENETEISMKGESITVKASVKQISQAWYDWQMRRMFIQDAFPFLTADEREFLMTGITPEEWGGMFEKEEEEEEK